MTKEDIIRMAREACDQAPREDWNSTAWVFGDESLVHFAALVAAAERNRIRTKQHWTEYERAIVAAEREACAQMVERMGIAGYGTLAIAGAIRVRRET